MIMGIRGSIFVEMVGLTLSMVSLILSLFIFCHFRNLWSTQTRLRKNLFIALGIQIIVRLIIAIHQLLRLSSPSSSSTSFSLSDGSGIPLDSSSSSTSLGNVYTDVSGTEFLRLNDINQKAVHSCETFFPVFILEYTRNAMFLWMFLEGLYLHSMITVFPVIHERLSLKFYYCTGWGTPIILTFIWVMMAAEKVNGRVCWRSYIFTPYFWILEGPKLTIIIMTLFFLLNVIRILVTKLWHSSSPEVNQVRKAVSRSIVVVPLLGITNYLYLQMRHSPLVDKEFTSWSYSTAFITSFQGVFAGAIYCFLNGEVQATLRRWHIERQNEQREIVMVNGGAAGSISISAGHRHHHHHHHHHNSSTNGGSNGGSVNNTGKTNDGSTRSSGFGLNLFGWGKRKAERGAEYATSCLSHPEMPCQEGQATVQEELIRKPDEDDDNDTATINPSSLSATSSIMLDPFKEHWNEADFSAHCNVDIEHIEIPIGYFTTYNKKKEHHVHHAHGSSGGVEARNDDSDLCPKCAGDEDSRRSSAFLVEIEEDIDELGSSIDLKSDDDGQECRVVEKSLLKGRSSDQ